MPAWLKQFSCTEFHLDLIKLCEITSYVKLFNIVKLVQFEHVDVLSFTSLLQKIPIHNFMFNLKK